MTWVLVFAVGAVIGSFLNVCVTRIPLGESIVGPGSHCRACKAGLSFGDLVPVVSYLALRGRCRHCGAPIPLRLLAVEVACGSVCALAYARFGPGATAAYVSVVGVLLVAVAACDLERLVIPNELSGAVFASGVLGHAIVGDMPVWHSLAGAAAGAAIALAVVVATRGGMGLGDVKLMAAVGGFLGWSGAICSFFGGALFGAIAGVCLMALRRRTRKDRIPFGPFVCLAALLIAFRGSPVWVLDWR